jgi:hypothetical protein
MDATERPVFLPTVPGQEAADRMRLAATPAEMLIDHDKHKVSFSSRLTSEASEDELSLMSPVIRRTQTSALVLASLVSTAISYNSCRNRHCPKCQTAEDKPVSRHGQVKGSPTRSLVC